MSPAQPASATLSLPSRRHEHPGAATPAAVDSHELLRGQKAVDIVHNGSTYRLQATRLGKLILTK
ncbi:MAG: hemin uptake protein HemP [Polaromonas sp.]|uniref:hemin uptake protein HemP n=1 Tax=Polaromonas sp. TaxID=1869339 RepID=UPI002487E421|nr:hemin uptake protein HemP [Polaromonas sp.]MDI1270470.1 hemin uptake protein HemP [Polaromonas sp.]MDP2448423.1 hemin uptake protein HemP [Polaromonas sp.]MDP3248680.1 hemin uptake protein HemP [Polaromonas sp.]MDP3757544.1 hemin uptake protein HemP [Polaromonas sp.]MDP3827242.1 hemin uptake protein HemP [Polaromonas sp.]